MDSVKFIYNFFDQIESKIKSRNLRSMQIAGDSALYSEISVRFLNCERPEEFLFSYGALLIAIQSTNYYVAYNYLTLMNNKAFHYKYEGKWKLIEELVSTKNIYYLNTYIEFLRSHYSPEDIFGNIVKKIAYYLEHYRTKRNNSETSKVRYPERKRGYKDKGSQRPTEKWLPVRYQELYSFEEEINRLKPVPVTPPHHKTEWINDRGSGV